jgi:hypothetical protein
MDASASFSSSAAARGGVGTDRGVGVSRAGRIDGIAPAVFDVGARGDETRLELVREESHVTVNATGRDATVARAVVIASASLARVSQISDDDG